MTRGPGALAKFNPFTHDVIVVDGVWGSGKTVLAPIISGMTGVEKFRLDPAFEYFCTLDHLGKLERDAAIALLLTYADMDQYHNLLSREVNLRWSDDSGILNNPGALTYIRRLFTDGGDDVVEHINARNLALHVMSHVLLPVAEPLFAAFGSRLKVVEMVRHPLYQVSHWHAYLSRYDGPREFTLSFDVKGEKVPWFASEWVDEYRSLSTTDRVLASIVRLHASLFSIIDKRRGDPALLAFSFEECAFQPEGVLRKLEGFLGRHHHPGVKRILKKQRLPRRQISQGKGHAAYGWGKTTTGTEREAYDAHRAFMEKRGTPKYIEPFLKLIAEYDRRWPSALSELAR